MRCSKSSKATRGLRALALLALGLGAAPAFGVEAFNTEESCLECHGLEGLALPGIPLWLDKDAHGGARHKKLACSDCHKGTAVYPHVEPKVRCDLPCHVPGSTHEAIARAELASAHRALGDPPCLGCHGAGSVSSAAERCHGCHRLAAAAGGPLDGPGAFGAGAHRRIGAGRKVPQCPDCHGFHGVAGGESARKACAKAECHPGVSESFGRLYDHSAPGRSGRRGVVGGALALGAVALAVLALHSLRRSR